MLGYGRQRRAWQRLVWRQFDASFGDGPVRGDSHLLRLDSYMRHRLGWRGRVLGLQLLRPARRRDHDEQAHTGGRLRPVGCHRDRGRCRTHLRDRLGRNRGLLGLELLRPARQRHDHFQLHTGGRLRPVECHRDHGWWLSHLRRRLGRQCLLLGREQLGPAGQQHRGRIHAGPGVSATARLPDRGRRGQHRPLCDGLAARVVAQ